MTFKPALNFGMFVSGIVVGDEIQLFPCWRRVVNEFEEFDPLLVPVPLLTNTDHLAAGGVQCGKQSSSAVALVVVGHGFCAALLDRQPRLSAVQRLNLALFIHAQDDSVFGRVQI